MGRMTNMTYQLWGESLLSIVEGYTHTCSCVSHEIKPGTVFLSMSGARYVVASLDDLGLAVCNPEGTTVSFLLDPREIRDNPLLTIVACGIG